MARASKYEDSRDVIISLLAKAVTTHGRPPTVREVAEATSVGVGTAHSYLVKLEEEGLVERHAGHRRVNLTEKGQIEAGLVVTTTAVP